MNFTILILATGLVVITVMVYRRRAFGSLDESSIRQLNQGEIVGIRLDRDTHCWRGIPFAEPPIGDFRWRAPRPAGPWAGTLKADHFSNKPVQIAGIGGGYSWREFGVPSGSEDCLYLNVWAPAMTVDEVANLSQPLPVMVWIYGGGNAVGASDVPLYAHCVRAGMQQAIVVSMNYRLGVLGWFHHEALCADGASEEDQSGNYGTLDIIQALRWVRDNIAAFGGNPDNVTVFGESAGGINVTSLMLSPLAKGLFHRAIAQSPVMNSYSVGETKNFADDEGRGHRNSSGEVVNRLLIQAGLASSRQAAKDLQRTMSQEELRDFLYALTTADLLAVFDGVEAGLYSTPRPIEDGYVLPDVSWHQAFASRRWLNDVPFMIGCTADEHKAFICWDTADYIDLRFGLIPRPRNPGQYESDARYGSLLWQAVSVAEPVAKLSQSMDSPVFVYRFDWRDWPKWPGLDLRELLGAFHASELFFLFGLFASYSWLSLVFGRRRFRKMLELSHILQSYWLQFARTGNPGKGVGGELPHWLSVSCGQDNLPNVMRLGESVEGQVRLSDRLSSIEGLRKQFLSDPELDSPERRARLYARVFAYGFHGAWDAPDDDALKDFSEQGAQRQLVEDFAQEIRFLP